MTTGFKKRVLFVVHGGRDFTAARDRIYVYENDWIKHNISAKYIDWRPLKNKDNLENIIENIVNASKEVDIVYLFRALLPLKAIKRIKNLGKKVVFDFDDAIYHVPSQQCSNLFASSTNFVEKCKQLFRYITRNNKYYSSRHNLLSHILKMCDSVVCGNNELGNYTLNYCKNVFISPTPIQVTDIKVKQHIDSVPVVIGWTGTPNNTNYLKILENVFDKLTKSFKDKVLFKIVSQELQYKFNNDRVVLEKWTKEKDIEILNTFDIGIMPLTDDGWSRGKCSYKALFCMGAGLPVVISPVGMNKDIINNENGFLAENDEEWINKLELLINSTILRAKIGQNARNYIENNFSKLKIQNKLAEHIISL